MASGNDCTSPLARFSARVAALPMENIDTDQILPAAYMKGLTRDGLGVHLFERMRYHPDGRPRADFVLNRPALRDAAILVAGANFGCGSSREHAVWALKDHGIRCIVAPSFGMIFAGNCARNGLLLIALDDGDAARVGAAQGQPVTVDLTAQTIHLPDGESIAFTIDARVRQRLLSGQDDIARTLTHADAIAAYETAPTGD
jgi:3-isopropylmalate/(R)-2-methylmalate dehydratase small subunit